METLQANPYAVGSVWYTSWGYDQTNVEFYLVVRESKASVWVQQIGATVQDGRLFPDIGRGLTNEVTMHRKSKSPEHPYLHIDYVRSAWPYTGGGRYDTHAGRATRTLAV